MESGQRADLVPTFSMTCPVMLLHGKAHPLLSEVMGTLSMTVPARDSTLFYTLDCVCCASIQAEQILHATSGNITRQACRM